MSRTLRARPACALALGFMAAGCQDYNFNPVGRCVIQPGTKRVTLSSVSSADVLFVVDDSGSMNEEQTALANNFSRFIGNLDQSNVSRVGNGLEPFDFHIAVTSTSVFWNPPTPTASVCSSSCQGAPAGQKVCCKADNTPLKQPMACTPGGPACPGTTTCGTNCYGFKGENYCCDQGTGSFPAGSIAAVVPCSREGTACGTLTTHYDFSQCADPVNHPGVGVDQWPFPGGDFVSWTTPTTWTKANPRVLHFDKELYDPAKNVNKQGFTHDDLMAFFRGGTAQGSAVQGNVMTGVCGSGQEQALSAAKLAIQRALDGKQKDTYARTGTGTTTLTPVATWNAASRTAQSAADWLAPGKTSKLVVVFVGDEDDCSSPKDPSGGVVMVDKDPGADSCVADANTDPPVGHKEDTVQSFADYFMGLGRPFGAAFIFPAAQESCTVDTCTAGPGVCSTGQAPGYRLLSTAEELRGRGADVVLGSICDPDFGAVLESIAEIVKPPSGLTLPTLPAANEVTVLRIASTSGQTRKLCSGPLAYDAAYTLQTAQATKAGWWFTTSPDPAPPAASSPTQYVYINPQGDCIANPGETYAADYIGQLPAGGCWDDAGANSADAMCQRILGGTAGSWTCFAEDAGSACATTIPASAPGTCICGSRADNCKP